jgi:hypothetical protein
MARISMKRKLSPAVNCIVLRIKGEYHSYCVFPTGRMGDRQPAIASTKWAFVPPLSAILQETLALFENIFDYFQSTSWFFSA